MTASVETGNDPVAAAQRPTIDALHRDIALANQYRLELIKLLMTLCAAILAFTVSFRPSLRDVQSSWLMWAGWIGLGISMVGGMIHMHGWDRFYVSYRDYEHRDLSGECKRRQINRWRRAGMIAQFAGFAVGVLAVAIFAAANIANVVAPIVSK